MVRRGVFILSIIFLAIATTSFGQIIMTTSGNWTDGTIWNGGAPTPTSGTTALPVSVGQSAFIDQNISITTGVYYMGWSGSAGTGTNATDLPGGTAYNLSVVKGGGYSATQAILDVKSGITLFEGTGLFDNSNAIIRAGASLILGATTVNNSVAFDVYGTLIINGNFDLFGNGSNSSFTIRDGGLVLVYGDFEAPVGGVTIEGGGDILATGSMSTNGSSTVLATQAIVPLARAQVETYARFPME
jgi:hypothetical protein